MATALHDRLRRQNRVAHRDHTSHGTGLADALIAASAEAAGATLVTLNRRHFPMLAEVLVPYAKA
jgi:predicted nucleic acid-binding protein